MPVRTPPVKKASAGEEPFPNERKIFFEAPERLYRSLEAIATRRKQTKKVILNEILERLVREEEG